MGRARIGAVIALEGEREFQSAVSHVDKELKKLASEGRVVSESFKGQERGMEALRAKEGLLRRTLEAHGRKVAELSSGLQHAREVYARTGDKLGELERAYEEARRGMAEMEGDAGTSAEALEAQRQEVERLQEGLKRGQAAYRRAEERVMRWETRLNDARAELLRTNHALEENGRALEQARQGTESLGEEERETEESARGMREVLEGSLAAGAVEAMAGKVMELGQAAAETAKEMQAARQQALASTGAAAAEAEKYGQIMKELYASNYGESFEDIGEAVGAVRRNLGDISGEGLKSAAEDAITLRDTFGMEYAEQLRAVKMLMDSFGVSSRQAYDLIVQGAQGGFNKNEDLLDTINEYSVHYKNMGASAEEFLNSLANGTAAGTFSVDKLGDAYKEFGIRVKDTASSTTEGFELAGLDADTMREKFAAGGSAARAATDETLQALFAMDDQVKQNQAGVDLFGTMWEDMGIDAIKALTDLNGEISVAKGAMESMKEVKYADIGSQIAGVAREIEMKLAEPLEKEWLPAVRDGLGFVSDNIGAIGTGLAGLAGTAAIWKLSQTGAGEAVIKVLKKVAYTRGLDAAATEAQALATKASTAAQSAFNAVASMNPIGKAMLAVAAAAGAYKLLKGAVEKAREEVINSDEALKESRETVDALAAEVDGLKGSAEEARKSREGSLEGIQAEYGAYEGLAGRLAALSEKERQTNGEKALMKSYIDQLNEAMPGLGLAIDENTGKLNRNGDSIREYIQATKERLAVEAQESMLGEILQEQMQAEIALAKAQEERESIARRLRKAESDLAFMEKAAASGSREYGMTCQEAYEGQENLRIKAREYQAQLEKLDGEMGKAREAAADAKGEYDLVAEAVSNAAEKSAGFSESAAEGTGAAAMAAREAAEAYTEMEEGIQKSLDGVASIFDEFSAGQEVSTEEMLRNLDSQEKGLREWKDNLEALAGAAGQGMTDELFQYLVQLGPQGANAVAELASSFRNGEPEFRQVCDRYKDVLKLQGDAASQITQSYYDTGLNAARGMKRGIEDGTPEAEAAARQMSERVVRTSRVTLQVNSPSRRMQKEVGAWIPAGVAKGIKEGTPAAERLAAAMGEKVMDAARQGTLKVKRVKARASMEVSLTWRQRQVIQEADNAAMREAEAAAAKADRLNASIYRKAQKQIEKRRKQGDLSATEEAAYWQKAMKAMEKGSMEYQKAAKNARGLAFEVSIEKKGSFGVSKKTGEGKAKTAARYSRDVLEAASGWLGNYKKQRDMAAAEEAVFWEKVRKQLKKGTAAYKEATKNIRDARKSDAQERLSSSDRLLSQYKVYYKVSAKAEAQYWDVVRRQFKKGTDERIEADSKYYEAKESLNSQLESLNGEYVRNCADVQERLKEGVQELTDAYQDAVKERADAIYSSFGLFDEFRSESESGASLLYNLKTQVAGLADWELQLEQLAGRGLPTGLLDELKAMGPEASAALHALNSLTEAQLEEYASLWRQKKELSQSQAVKELEPMRRQAGQEINALVSGTKEELASLKKGYQEAAAELKEGMSSALKKVAKSTRKTGEDATAALVAGIRKGAEKKSTGASLEKASDTIGKGLGKLPKAGREIGSRTLEGILQGLSDKKAMQKSARQLIDGLKKEIQAAAEIHSPSRLFKREVGLQLPAGIGEGMEEGAKGMGAKGAAMVRGLLEAYKGELARQECSLWQASGVLVAGQGIAAANALLAPSALPAPAPAGGSGTDGAILEMLSLMQRYIPQLAERQVVLDSGQAIGALGGGLGEELAMRNRRARR